MKLEPVKRYNKPKYPTEEVVKDNKDLLSQPLDRWKKIGVTSVILTALLMKLDTANADSTMLTPADLEPIYNPSLCDGAVPSMREEIAFFKTKKGVENYFLVDELIKTTSSIRTTSEFKYMIELFLDWLLIQGIM